MLLLSLLCFKITHNYMFGLPCPLNNLCGLKLSSNKVLPDFNVVTWKFIDFFL